MSSVLTIAVTALGDLENRDAVTRSGARAGDIVAIAGELGQAAHGLEVLFAKFRDGAEPVAIDTSKLVDSEVRALTAQLRPSPPIGLGPVAAVAGATAMMDVSDGLALDAGRMAEASGVTISLRSSALGSDPARALAGGEDHALLATFASDGALPPGFVEIGVVQQTEGAPTVLCDGIVADPQGWDPYRDWDAAAG